MQKCTICAKTQTGARRNGISSERCTFATEDSELAIITVHVGLGYEAIQEVSRFRCIAFTSEVFPDSTHIMVAEYGYATIRYATYTLTP